MDCVECQMMSSEDIDGELPEEKAVQMMDHLALCKACKSDYQLTLLLRDSLNEEISLAQTINIPTDFPGKIINLIEKKGARESYDEKPQESAASSFLDRLIAKISLRPLSAFPVLSFSVALALVLTVSLSLYFKQSSPEHFSLKAELTDATKLNTKIVKVKNSNNQTLENDLNFYANRHAEARFGMSTYVPNSGIMQRASFSTNR